MDLKKSVKQLKKDVAELKRQLKEPPQKVILQFDGQTIATYLMENHD